MWSKGPKVINYKFIFLNPFLPKGFPIDKYNHLALDRVKSNKCQLTLTGGKGLNLNLGENPPLNRVKCNLT